MVLHVLCAACKKGQHDKHTKIIRGVSDGKLGGVQCHCKGDCVEKLAKQIADEAMRFGGNA